MNRPTAYLLKEGRQLHLQHGPIDLLIEADGAREAAFAAAHARFQTVLEGLVAELPALRDPLTPDSPAFRDPIAERMRAACLPHCTRNLTSMIAVAGAVADTVLAAMLPAAPTRALVNNGGDIALHLGPDTTYTAAMAASDGTTLGRITLTAKDPVRGIATSGWRGRSHSLGIADSVTVLAHSAAAADVVATLIANAVDLPGHPAVRRTPARDLFPDSDLGAQLVTTHVATLPDTDAARALDTGAQLADHMLRDGHIVAAALFLQGQSRLVGTTGLHSLQERTLTHA